MAGEDPQPGLVIRHAYLWRNEAELGRQEGLKDRPCAIVHTRVNEFKDREVFVAPITHSRPKDEEHAVALPPATKKRLGLDDDNSWVVLSEVNRFIWPGPDIRPVAPGRMSYGHLPADLTRDIVERIRENARNKVLSVVNREEGAPPPKTPPPSKPAKHAK